MRSRCPADRAADRGAATAELAVAMPAVVLLIALSLGGVGLAGEQVRLQHAAAQQAREAGRQQPGEVVCISVSEPAPPPFGAIVLSARACAPGGGR